MATQTRFDLNAAFESWRNELAAQPQLLAEDRRELERHLADSMAELRQRGLNEEEAFWLARRRIGQPQELAQEFEKAEPLKVWRERAFWMAASVMAFVMWMQVAGPLLNLLDALLRAHSSAFGLWGLPLLIFYLPVALAIALIAKGWMRWLARKSAIILQSQVRLAVTNVLLVAIFSFLDALIFRLAFPNAKAPTGTSLFDLTTQNMVMPLIFVPLLCLFMPKKAKTPRRA